MQCKVCGKKAESDYCFKHKPRKLIAAVKSLVNKRKTSDRSPKVLHELFMNIWKKRKHYSEVSGTYLGKEALSIYFHHILPKNKYPNASLDEENIIFLTLEEHDQVEMDIYRYEEINNRRKYLIDKYTREAGVRGLERVFASLFRKVAKKIITNK